MNVFLRKLDRGTFEIFSNMREGGKCQRGAQGSSIKLARLRKVKKTKFQNLPRCFQGALVAGITGKVNAVRSFQSTSGYYPVKGATYPGSAS